MFWRFFTRLCYEKLVSAPSCPSVSSSVYVSVRYFRLGVRCVNCFSIAFSCFWHILSLSKYANFFINSTDSWPIGCYFSLKINIFKAMLYELLLSLCIHKVKFQQLTEGSLVGVGWECYHLLKFGFWVSLIPHLPRKSWENSLKVSVVICCNTTVLFFHLLLLTFVSVVHSCVYSGFIFA